MARDDNSTARAHEGADETVERHITATPEASFTSCLEARLPRSIACGQDDEIGVKSKIEYLSKRQEAIRLVAGAEAGQEGRPRRAV